MFLWEGEGFVKVIDEVSLNVDRLLEKIGGEDRIRSNGRVLFTGEGVFLYREKIVQFMGARAIFPPAEKTTPSPANVAALGLRRAEKGEFSDPLMLSPFYIRRSEAEIKRNV